MKFRISLFLTDIICLICEHSILSKKFKEYINEKFINQVVIPLYSSLYKPRCKYVHSVPLRLNPTNRSTNIYLSTKILFFHLPFSTSPFFLPIITK